MPNNCQASARSFLRPDSQSFSETGLLNGGAMSAFASQRAASVSFVCAMRTWGTEYIAIVTARAQKSEKLRIIGEVSKVEGLVASGECQVASGIELNLWSVTLAAWDVNGCTRNEQWLR